MTHHNANLVRDAARGRWMQILGALAPELAPALRKYGRHVPCPVHGGRDGFRLFKDVEETGGGICNTCGSRHDGFAVLMWINHWDFKQTLNQVADYLGVEKQPVEPVHPAGNKNADREETATAVAPLVDARPRNVPVKHQPYEGGYNAKLHERIRKLWADCMPYSSRQAEPVRRYFNSRQIWFDVDEVEKSDSLRFKPDLPYYEEDGREAGTFPAIVCAIRDVAGNLITLHRTYLTTAGNKAKVDNVKKMYPVPEGCELSGASVRLGEPKEGILGLAEGLETALSVYRITQIPVWSTVNATLMAAFEVPAGVHTVLIWADKDQSYTGEKSAYILKARLECLGLKAFVLLPALPIPAQAKGVDWNDVLMKEGGRGFPNPRYLRDFISRIRQEV